MKFLPSLGPRTPVTQTKAAVDRRHSAGPYYQPRGIPMSPPMGDLDIDKSVKDSWSRVVWAYRAIDARAKNAARLTIQVTDGRGREAREIENHRIATLLNRRANPYESGQAFRYRLHTQLDLSVKGVFIEVNYNRGGEPGRIDLLNPKMTFPIPDADKFVSGYEMRLPNGEVFNNLPPFEEGKGGVIWVKRPHPTDPYSSSTWLSAAGMSIDLDHYARVYNRNFLLNDGRPGGILAIGPDSDISEADAETLQSRMSGGPGSAGRVTILEADQVTYHDTAITARDAQYVESRALSKGEILAAAGTPESLWNASGRTYDNADAELEGWWRNEMMPECDLVATFYEEMTPGGVEDDSEVVTYRYDEIWVLGRDERAEDERLAKQQADGLISVDEYRTGTGKDAKDLPGTRVLWLAAGKAPVGDDEDVQAILTQGQPQGPGGEPPPDGGAPPADGGGEGPPDDGAPSAEQPTGDDPIGAALEEKGYGGGRGDPFARHRTVQAAVVYQWEKAVADELAALLRRQQKVVEARLHGKARKHTRHWEYTNSEPPAELKALNAKYVVDRNRWIDEVVAAVTDIVRAAFEAAGKFIAVQLGDGEFEADSDDANEIIAQTVRIIAEGFDARTGRLQEAISAADEAGKSIDDIAADVAEAYVAAETWKDVTSRQVVGAMNAAQNIAAASAGAVKKRWLATDDERTRPTHREAEGQVVDMGDKFSVGEGELLFPGDVTGPVGEWINCRCTMLFQTAERDFDAELDEDLADLEAFESSLEDKAARRAAGFVAAVVRFNPRLHPRDYRGRFIDTPDVHLPDGSTGVAVSVDKDGTVTVAKADGAVVQAPAATVTEPAKPSPTYMFRGELSEGKPTEAEQEQAHRIADYLNRTMLPNDPLVFASVEPSQVRPPRTDVRWEEGEGRVYATIPRDEYEGTPQQLELDPKDSGRALIGMLRWDDTADIPTIVDVSVDENYRRRGIATAMFNRAKEKQSGLEHSEVLTDDGAAWAVSADVTLPQVGETVDTHVGKVTVTETGYLIESTVNGEPVTFEVTPPSADHNRQAGSMRIIRTDSESLAWQDVVEKYPLYSEYGFDFAVSELVNNGEDYSMEGLRFTEQIVSPNDVVFQRYPESDPRMERAMQGYRDGTMAPVLLVHRAGEYLTVDGHHRLSAAEALDLSVPAVVAHSIRDDKYEGGARIGKLKPKRRAAQVVDTPHVSADTRLFESDGGYIDAIIALVGEMLFSATYDEPEGGEYEVIAEVPAAPQGPIGTFRRTGMVAANLGPNAKNDLREAIVTLNQHLPEPGWSGEKEADVRKGEPTIIFEWKPNDTVVMEIGVDTEHFGFVGSDKTTKTFELPRDVTPATAPDFFHNWARDIGLPFRAYHDSRDEKPFARSGGSGDPPVRERTAQAQAAARQARRNVPKVIDLVDGGMSHADAVAEWKRLYRNEKARLARARTDDDTEVAQAIERDALSVLRPYDPAVQDDITSDSPTPKALYGLTLEAWKQLREAGFEAGPGAVPTTSFNMTRPETWATNAQQIPEGEIIPVRGVVHQGQTIKQGFATRRDGMAYLVETTGDDPEYARMFADAYFARMHGFWQEATQGVADEFVSTTKGIGYSQIPLSRDPIGLQRINATGGDGTITIWNVEIRPGLLQHELGHNIDAEPIFTLQGDRESNRPEWATARGRDALNIEDFASRYVLVETGKMPHDHPIDLDQRQGPTAYGASDAAEDFAESNRLYLRDQQDGFLGYTTDEFGNDTGTVRFADVWPWRARFFDNLYGNTPAQLSPHAVLRLAEAVGRIGAVSTWTDSQLRSLVRQHGVDPGVFPDAMTREEMLGVLERLGVITREQAA